MVGLKGVQRRYDVKMVSKHFWSSGYPKHQQLSERVVGHCYRLYSSAVFEHQFDSFSLPEIRRMPIEGVRTPDEEYAYRPCRQLPFPYAAGLIGTSPSRENSHSPRRSL